MNEPRKAKVYRNTRFSQETIDEIFRLWKMNRYSLQSIAEKVGMSATTVGRIIRGEKVKL